MSEMAALLGNMHLFRGLSPASLALVEKLVFMNRFAAGDAVCQEGDSSDFMCFVVKGRLDVAKLSESGHTVVIAHLTSGDSMGEMALIDHQPRSATVRATEDTSLLILTRKGFMQLRKRYPEIANVILENIALLLSNNLRRTSAQLAQYAGVLA